MKENWKETLKLWLGAILLFFVTMAEAVSTGCKKHSTLPKKVMALCVAAAIVVAMVPAYVFAADTHTNHCVCGKQESVHSGCKNVEWTAWNGTDAIPYDSNKTAYVYLSANAERASTLTVNSGYTLYLCLSGNTLSPASGFTGRAIEVSSGATFVLTDCGTHGAISGFTSSTGGGGVRNNGGTFTMYGGTISNNRTTGTGVAGDGGGVYNYGGTVTMYGGTISGNTASRYGGGVCNDGTFAMENVTISGNTAAYSAGGVYNYGTFTMENVTVSDNTANTAESTYGANGGGIYCSAGTLTMRGGTISSNEIKGTRNTYGGGITVGNGATVEITDVTISGNTAYDGGGITVGSGATAEITDVTISGNTAYNGGGVCNYGAFTMESVTVSGNTSTNYGGGVYNSGTLNLSGNTKIIDNTKGTAGNLTPNNIYLLSGKTVTVAGALTCEDASIGVTMTYKGGTFTTGGAAYIGKFVSDDSTYGIAVDGENLALKFQYTVTFDYGTLGSETKTVFKDETVTPPTPVFAGKVLVGWYKDKWFYTEFNFSDAITNTTTTIYAKFADYEDDKAELQDAIDTLETAVGNVETALNNKVSTDKLTEEVGKLNQAIADAKAYADTQDAALKNALEAADAMINTAINELKDRVSALESGLTTANGKINTNASDIGALKNDVAIIQTWKTEAQDAIDALETLAGTQGTNISALQTAVADLQTAVSTANSKIAAAEARIAALEGKVAALETATTNLQTAVTALQTAVADKADTATVNAAIANLQAAIAALEAVKDDYAAADTALKAELEGKISAAQTAAISAAETLVNNAKAELQSKIDTKADAATTTAAIQNLQAAVAALEAVKDDYAAADTALKAELEGKISAAQTAAISAAETLVNNAKVELQSKIDAKADAATTTVAIQNLQAAVAALESVKDDYATADAALKTELESKISAAQTAAISAAETLVNNAKAELQSKIDAKADAATTTAAIQNLQAAVAALESVKDDYVAADAALKTELEGKISAAQTAAISAAETLVNNVKAELTAAINNKADTATLNAKISELNTAIATAEAAAKAYTDGAAAALTTAIATAKSEAISAAETLVNNAKSELQSAIDTKADAATVNAAIANLQNAITALENAKDNYVSADAALKAELEAAIAKAKQEAIDAAKGHIPYIGENGNWWIGDTDTGVDANGIKGDTGNGIASITTKKENGVTTVTITFTDPEKEPVVFTISDGETGATGATGADGAGVAKVEKTATNGNVDTYTITLTNGKTYTFTVTNGKDGENGKDGMTPFIGENGNWWIGDTDTGVKAVAEQPAQKGTDTITVVSIVVASVALLSNLAIVVWIVTKKKKVLV